MPPLILITVKTTWSGNAATAKACVSSTPVISNVPAVPQMKTIIDKYVTGWHMQYQLTIRETTKIQLFLKMLLNSEVKYYVSYFSIISIGHFSQSIVNGNIEGRSTPWNTVPSCMKECNHTQVSSILPQMALQNFHYKPWDLSFDCTFIEFSCILISASYYCFLLLIKKSSHLQNHSSKAYFTK